MTVAHQKVVSVSYRLTVPGSEGDETLVETTEKNRPFVFLFGSGDVLKEFEQKLSGKKAGDRFDFFIDSDHAYGPRDEKLVINIPMTAFTAADGTVDLNLLKIGKVLPMSDGQGNRMEGEVKEVTPSHVKMDFNHFLAGLTLHFVGEILNVRTATAEEINHGHVHGPGGHHH